MRKIRAKHFVLQEWQRYDENKIYTNISVDSLAVVRNKLFYHVLLTNQEKVIVDESTGAYFDSTEIQHLFVDVQNGNVTEGEFIATNGETVTPEDDDDSFLPAFTLTTTLPALLVGCAVVVTFVYRKEEKKNLKP